MSVFGNHGVAYQVINSVPIVLLSPEMKEHVPTLFTCQKSHVLSIPNNIDQ